MPRAEDQAVADVAALLGQAGDWAARSQGLAQLREFAETHESPELVADAVGILIPHLAEMLKELRSALLGDCCDTIAVLVQRCAPRPAPPPPLRCDGASHAMRCVGSGASRCSRGSCRCWWRS